MKASRCYSDYVLGRNDNLFVISRRVRVSEELVIH